MAVQTYNLGTITAYGDAVAGGYTGTKEEWQTLMASYADVARQATSAVAIAYAKANEASASADRAEQAAASVGTPDTTLTQEGVAADAKATGDEVSLLKEDLTKISTATLSDVGKTLKVKTVESGKVTEWEFSEAVTDIALSIVNGQLCMTYSE